jgi:hypothetical protein
MKRPKAFLNYSHKDRTYLEEFQKYLASFERNGLLELWVATKIAPGQRWFDEIRAGLTSARLAIFLVVASGITADQMIRSLLS